MARVQFVIGEHEELPAFFCGHEGNGAPLRRSSSSHITFAFEPTSRVLVVLAPHLVERRSATDHEREHLRRLDAALEGFHELRAGKAGRLRLFACSPADVEALVGRSNTWESVTSYAVTWHAKGVGAVEALAVDVRAECRRLGLPEPKIESRDIRGVSGVGLVGHVRMKFSQSVSGPVLLGRTRHFGGGLFRPVKARASEI